MGSITIGSRGELSQPLLASIHEFRRAIFIDRLEWPLPLLGGIECDQYDHADARYFVMRDDVGRVTACSRLLPTTAKYMLPELFPQLLGKMPPPCDPSVWELSRFATNVCGTSGRRILSLSRPTLDLLDSVLTFAREHHVARLALATSIAIERLMLRAGIDAHRIGAPSLVDKVLCVATYIEVPATQLNVTTAVAHARSRQCRALRTGAMS